MTPSNVCAHGHLARQCEVCDLTAEVARLTALLDPIRTLFAPIPDARLVASIGRAWCARANEEGLRQERDDALADWKQAEANGEAFATERDQARALVARVLDSHRQPWAYGMSVTITSGQVYAAWRADIEAALVPTSLEED